MIYIYEKYFKEMGFSQDKFEERITGNMKHFIIHLIKIKLSDKEFGDKYLLNGISGFVKEWISAWKNHSIKHLTELFRKLNDYKIKFGSKEKAYLSVLENMGLIISDEYKKELLDSLDLFPDQNKLKQQIDLFWLNYFIDEFEWFKEIKQFLFEIKPIRNKVISAEESIEKFEDFYKIFTKDFK